MNKQFDYDGGTGLRLTVRTHEDAPDLFAVSIDRDGLAEDVVDANELRWLANRLSEAAR